MEIEHRPVLLQAVAVDLSQYGAATGREYRVGMLHVFGDDRLLAVTEAGLPLQFEDHGDRYAEAAFELAVGIVERLPEALGEQAPERRLAAARHAHQKQIAPMQMH